MKIVCEDGRFNWRAAKFPSYEAKETLKKIIIRSQFQPIRNKVVKTVISFVSSLFVDRSSFWKMRRFSIIARSIITEGNRSIKVLVGCGSCYQLLRILVSKSLVVLISPRIPSKSEPWRVLSSFTPSLSEWENITISFIL